MKYSTQIMTHQNYTQQATEYLVSRGLTEQTLEALQIRWISKNEAEMFGYSSEVISNDGIILFPLNKDESYTVAKNFYASPENEQIYLKQINVAREKREKHPLKKIPKYVLPMGPSRNDSYYDPYALLKPGDATSIEFATEDVIGVIKAAQKGHRIISTIGVWVVNNNQFDSARESPEFFTHPLKDKIPYFLADSDAIAKIGVFQALIRTGFILGCPVGYFSTNQAQSKIGLDEYIDQEQPFEDLKNKAIPIRELVLNSIPEVNKAISEVYSDRSETERIFLIKQFYDFTITELMKNLPDFPSFKRDYESLFRNFGYRAVDFQELSSRAGLLGESSESKGSSESVAKSLIEIGRECELFHDCEKVAYADIEIKGSRHTYKLRSQEFKNWLAGELFKREEKAANSDAQSSAINTLESIAVFEGPEIDVHLRTAEYEGKIYLDLANEQWQAIEIGADGWEKIDRPPIRFIRPSTILPLPVPDRNGDIVELKNLLRIEGSSWILLALFLLYSIMPNRTYPVLLLVASRGSGKSTMAEFLKALIDPCKAPLIGMKTNDRDAAIVGLNTWIITYDNVSHITPQQSDILCRFATGFGFRTRKLYSDTDETVIELARPQIITAIDHVVTRDDLADRVLLVELPPIPEGERLPKGELDKRLTQLKPKIFGGLLNIMPQVLAKLPSTKPDRLPRMADFGLFAIAAEEVLGFESGSFMKAFDRNRESSRQVVLEASPLAGQLITFVESEDCWSGTASELLEKLELMTDRQITQTSFWPKTASHLVRQINRLKPDLEAIGIQITFSRSNREKRLSIQRTLNTLSHSEPTSYQNMPSQPSLITPETLQLPLEEDFKDDDNGDVRVTVAAPLTAM